MQSADFFKEFEQNCLHFQVFRMQNVFFTITVVEEIRRYILL